MIQRKTIGLITVMVMSSFFITAQSRYELMAWEVKADTLLNQGDFKGAADLLTTLINKTRFVSAEDYDLYYKRGVASFELKEFEKAIADANRFLKGSGNDQGHVLKVYIYQQMDKPDDAIGQIDSLQRKYPDNAELAQWRIQTLMEAERYSDAKSELKKAIAKNPNPKMSLFLGLSHYHLGEFNEAFATFNEITSADPSFMEGYLYPASLCLEDGLYEKSLEFCEKGLKQNSADPNLLFYKGVALYELKNVDESCRYLARAFNKGMDDAADYLKEYCYGVE